jgi:hypothetical protein
MPEPKSRPRVTPEAAEIIETYFARVHGAMLVTAAGEVVEAVEELRSHVLEQLAHTDGSGRAVSRILAELGPPETLASEYADGAVPDARDGSSADEPSALTGTFLGMPYDLRVPTATRIASRWWDPMNPRVFVPRVFGLGWDINFGAVAVVLGIVRPDDEDEPFGAVPRGWLLTAFSVPVALTAAVVALVAGSYAGWPALAPVQWSMTGAPSSFWPKAVVAAFLVAMSALPTLGASSTWVRRRPALNRAASAAGATLMATIALAQTVQTVRTLAGVAGMWPTWTGLVMAILLPFLMLTGLSRAGRSQEQRRDMKTDQKKERV